MTDTRGTTRRRSHSGRRIPSGDTDSGFEALIKQLDAALRDEARLWNELAGGKYELLYHRKPTQRDLTIAVRTLTKGELPEVVRWKLARLVGGPLSHE